MKFRIPNSEFRIMDVNINRVRESLRVIEDIVRFALKDKRLTEKVKDFREDFRKTVDFIPQEKLLRARESAKDVGAKSYTPSEGQRTNINEIFRANVKRTEEALRVLEEFSKTINPGLGKNFKSLRFRLYTLEKEIITHYPLPVSRFPDFDLYVITDPGFGRSHLEIVKKAIAGGVKIVQLRDKSASKKDYFKWAKEIREITRKAGITFIVNDYIDIALAVDADGVHLGQADLPVKIAREILGENKIIGVSTHNLLQALKAEKDGANYISVGPIFETPLKPDIKPLGPGFINVVKRRIKIPCMAIGGINESNLSKVGIKRVAVIRAVAGAKNITKAVKNLRAKLRRLS